MCKLRSRLKRWGFPTDTITPIQFIGINGDVAAYEHGILKLIICEI